jgi:hypothetical protein
VHALFAFCSKNEGKQKPPGRENVLAAWRLSVRAGSMGARKRAKIKTNQQQILSKPNAMKTRFQLLRRRQDYANPNKINILFVLICI